MFWTSGDVCPGFQSQGGFPCLCALLPVCNGFHRFISGATPADPLVASMEAEPFRSKYLSFRIFEIIIITNSILTQILDWKRPISET